MLHRITGKCGECGNEFTSLKVDSVKTVQRFICRDGCKSYDRTIQVIDSITYGIEHDKYVVTDETKEALARMNAAVARQDKRFK